MLKTASALVASTIVTASILVSPHSALAVDELDHLIAPDAEAVVLGEGYGFCEGPAVDPSGNIYFSDGRNDTIHFYPIGGSVTTFVDDSTDANGMMFNHKGELVVCEGAAYRLVAFDVATKEKRVLIDQIDGTRFNEPNDLTIDPSGGIYFTDPNYRHRGQETVMKEDVYYLSAPGEVRRVSTICEKPNGIISTPDGKTLYLADNRGRVIYRFDILGPGKLGEPKRWIELDGGPDGMTLDRHGNLYIACGGKGVEIFSPEGEMIGVLGKDRGIPYASNCCFGGPDLKTLYITSAKQFLGIPMKVEGLPSLAAESK